MLYHSTNHKSPKVDFREATLQGQAPDRGLYFPERIPKFLPEQVEQLLRKPKAEIAFEVIQPYVGDSIPADELMNICRHTVNFDFPLVPVTDNVFSLELFHGPTLAFKDVGARFMSRCLSYFSQTDKTKTTVLVATSGDTGSAVANGFLGVEGVDVIILYPSGKVSRLQELQLTTLGKNITALEVAGTFDDCQHMVKRAFADDELRQKLKLTSANSINVARWLPQQFYYFFALASWKETNPPVFSVGSGNFGNLCAGLLAYVSGLPVHHFIAACNSNDVFTNFLTTGIFQPKPAVATISNAMDVGNPSNFVRILELFNNDYDVIKNLISSYRISDEETRNTIAEVLKEHKYQTDPHGAVGYSALTHYLKDHKYQKGIFLETAHPIKFNEVIEQVTGLEIPVPEAVQNLRHLTKQSIKMNPDFESLKSFLIDSKL